MFPAASKIAPAIGGPIMVPMPSNRASKLNAEVKFSSPRSSTRTIVLRMKNVVKNPYINIITIGKGISRLLTYY